MSETSRETHDFSQVMEHIQNQMKQAAASLPKRNLRDVKLTHPYPAKPADIPYNLTLYNNIESAQNHIPNYNRELLIQSSSLTKLPIIGKLVHTIQTKLHQIALFYTNRALRHQYEVNQHLLECIEQLTVETQKQQRTINQLQHLIYTLQEDPSS